MLRNSLDLYRNGIHFIYIADGSSFTRMIFIKMELGSGSSKITPLFGLYAVNLGELLLCWMGPQSMDDCKRLLKVAMQLKSTKVASAQQMIYLKDNWTGQSENPVNQVACSPPPSHFSPRLGYHDVHASSTGGLLSRCGLASCIDSFCSIKLSISCDDITPENVVNSARDGSLREALQPPICFQKYLCQGLISILLVFVDCKD